MNPTHIITALEQNKEVFRHLLMNIEESEYHWRPAPGKWNLLEIVCHLHDEEIDDFRTRVKLVLETPEKPLPPFNPEAWVTERRYSEKQYTTMLEAFITEREKSINWLRSLENPQWGNVNEHPDAGPRSAQLFLENWLGHDLLHMRQIIGVKFQYAEHLSENGLSYAGKW